jgi:hypothetical protein
MVSRHLFAGQFSWLDGASIAGMLLVAMVLGLVAVKRLVRRLVV